MTAASLVFLSVLFAADGDFSGKIEGRITTKGKDPIAAAEVQVRLVTPRGEDSDVRIAKTGPDGEFAFEGLRPGLYVITASKDGWVPSRDRVTISNQPGRREVGADLTMELTTWRKFTGALQAGALAYVFGLGLLVLIGNFFVAPKPSKALTGAGWAILAVAVVVAFLRWAPSHATSISVVAAGAGWLIQRRGGRAARVREASEQEEARHAEELKRHDRERIQALVDQEGTTISDLKPYGEASIAGQTIEVKSTRGLIPRNVHVVVRGIVDGKPMVEPVE